MIRNMFDGALHHLVSFLKWKRKMKILCNLLCGDFSCSDHKLRRVSLSLLMRFPDMDLLAITGKVKIIWRQSMFPMVVVGGIELHHTSWPVVTITNLLVMFNIIYTPLAGDIM